MIWTGEGKGGEELPTYGLCLQFLPFSIAASRLAMRFLRSHDVPTAMFEGGSAYLSV